MFRRILSITLVVSAILTLSSVGPTYGFACDGANVVGVAHGDGSDAQGPQR